MSQREPVTVWTITWGVVWGLLIYSLIGALMVLLFLGVAGREFDGEWKKPGGPVSNLPISPPASPQVELPAPSSLPDAAPEPTQDATDPASQVGHMQEVPHAGRGRDECLAESKGVADERYARCRSGWVERVWVPD